MLCRILFRCIGNTGKQSCKYLFHPVCITLLNAAVQGINVIPFTQRRIRCVKQGDTEGMKKIFTALFAGITYTSEKDPAEHYFETVIYLVFTLLGKFVHSEVHSAKGRADCIVEVKDYVYVFEFKLDKSADKALDQIAEKGYALPYAADLRKVYTIGVNFDSRERNITEWKVEG